MNKDACLSLRHYWQLDRRDLAHRAADEKDAAVCQLSEAQAVECGAVEQESVDP